MRFDDRLIFDSLKKQWWYWMGVVATPENWDPYNIGSSQQGQVLEHISSRSESGKWVITKHFYHNIELYFSLIFPFLSFSAVNARDWSSEIPLSESMEIFGISQFMFGQPWCSVKRN